MFLDRIVASKKTELEALIPGFRLEKVEAEISKLPSCRGFQRALTTGKRRDTGLIAEVKKASPSKGLIRADFDPVSIARSYEAAGADCISVLTDAPFFQGSNRYLQEVREAVDRPLLRKDFTIDFRQIYEARLLGADAVLLIAAILTRAEMKEFLTISSDLGLDALVEVHDRAELETVLELEASFIGINNRNLKTFHTDLATTEQLIPIIPTGKTIVSESGIASFNDVQRVRENGAHAILVGEHFMRQPSVEQAVIGLMEGSSKVEA
jgi:indole-3-glycerol phosphate synthase